MSYLSSDFQLDPFLKETISQVREEFAKKTASLDMNYFESTQLNKAVAKQYKLSPDSLMQLTVQVRMQNTLAIPLREITVSTFT